MQTRAFEISKYKGITNTPYNITKITTTTPPPMSKKESWTTEQIDALFAVFDKVSPGELNVIMQPGARFGNIMEQACEAVFGVVDSKNMSRVRSRVSRVKRDFFDYLKLIKDKEKDPSLSEDEEYSKKLTSIYRRLPKSLVGLEVTFDLKELADDGDEEVTNEKPKGKDKGKGKDKKDSVPPEARPKALFRVNPVEDDRSSPIDEGEIITGKYKIDGYGSGATVEKMGEIGVSGASGASGAADLPADETMHIGEYDLLAEPKSKNQVSALVARRREQAAAAKALKEREERLRLRKEGLEGGKASLFDASGVEGFDRGGEGVEGVGEVVKEAASSGKASSKTPKKTDKSEPKKRVSKKSSNKQSPPADTTNYFHQFLIDKRPDKGFSKVRPPRPKEYSRITSSSQFHSSDDEDDLVFHSASTLPTSTPKALKRHHQSSTANQEHSSPTKRNSSHSQRLSVGLDDEVDFSDDTLTGALTGARDQSRDNSNSEFPEVQEPQSREYELPEVQEPPKKKRGRPKRDESRTASTTATKAVTKAATKAASAETKTATVTKPAAATKTATTPTSSTAKEVPTASKSNTSLSNTSTVTSHHLPQYLDGMQQFLSSVERLYVLADGDPTMRKALAKLVTATTEKIERSMDGGGGV